MEVKVPGKMGCDHRWLYDSPTNTQLCIICGRCETPNPQTALVYVPLWENPKVLIVKIKSLTMSNTEQVRKDLGGFYLGYPESS